MSKNTKKNILQGLTVLALMIAGLMLFMPSAFAGQFIPLGGEGYQSFPVPEGETGVEIAKSLVGKIVDNIRYIIGAIAILTIVISGVRLVMSQGNEENYNKARDAILYAIGGLVIVGMAGELSNILSVEKGSFLKDPTKTLKQARLFNRSLEVVLTMVKYLVGGIAVAFIVRSGLRMVVMGGKDEELQKDKKNLAWSLIGLVIILVASPLVNKVFFKIDTSAYPGIDAVRPIVSPGKGIEIISALTSLLVIFAAPLAVLFLVIGAVMYITAGGEDEKLGKAKKLILWALIGLVVIYGAFGIVSTFIRGQFEGI